jgi:GT2 family glycosyltransferase
MISIITAIYNQLEMNKLFYEYIVKYSKNPFELIIIDNKSTDGSCEFFESKGAKIIRNNGNYSYPYCQNRGIEIAKNNYFIFLNNDVLVSKNWDERAIQIMKKHGLDIASCSSPEKIETKEKTHVHFKKWKYIKNPFIFLFGNHTWVLKLTHRLMYGNWEKWTEMRYEKFKDSIILGIAGNNVIITRRGLEKVGMWDEKIQCADFDIFLKAKKRNIEIGDIKPVHVLPGVYVHHFNRLTFKNDFPPFLDKDNLITIEEKWGLDSANELLREADMVVGKK